MVVDKVDKAIKEEQILYDIAKDRYEKLGIKNYLRRMEEHKQYIELFEELKELRKENETIKALQGGIEEQGLMLRLPCKVEDTVWFIGNKFVNDYEVRRFIIGETGIDAIQVAKTIDGTDYWNSFSIDEIGKTVFLTKAEAEQKLKEMESE